MDALAFGWQPARRLAALQRQLAADLSDWLADWSLDGTPPELVCPAEPVAGFRQLYAQDGALLGLACEPGSIARLGARLAAVSGPEAAPLAEDLGEAALCDLARRWLDCAEGPEPQRIAASADVTRRFDPRFRAAHLTLQWRDCALRFALDAAAVARRQPRPTPAVHCVPLALRQDAMGESSTGIELRLPLGAATLADFVDLGVGDVVLCEAELNTPLRLHTAAAPLPFDCRLVRHAGRKAALLESRTSP